MTKKASDRMKKAIGKAQKKRWAEYRAGKRTWKFNGKEYKYGKGATEKNAEMPPASTMHTEVPIGSEIVVRGEGGGVVTVRAAHFGIEVLRSRIDGSVLFLTVEG